MQLLENDSMKFLNDLLVESPNDLLGMLTAVRSLIAPLDSCLKQAERVHLQV